MLLSLSGCLCVITSSAKFKHAKLLDLADVRLFSVFVFLSKHKKIILNVEAQGRVKNALKAQTEDDCSNNR